MPTNRRRRPHSRRREEFLSLDGDQLSHLREGWFYFDGAGFGNLDDLLEAWELHSDSLLAPFIEERPGRRPFGWWVARGEERPIIAPRISPGFVAHLRSQSLGFLHCSVRCGRNLDPLQEPEPVALAKAREITDRELAAMRREVANLDPSRHPFLVRDLREGIAILEA